ncbi:MAG: DsbA family protein [Alphaproteobacteria bacterium]
MKKPYFLISLIAIVAIVGIGAWYFITQQGLTSNPATPEHGMALSDAARQALVIAPDDFVLGKPEAPVTIIEYSSLTCPHCAAFHRETLPLLKERFINTGKAKLVLRDYPLDDVALRAATAAHCVGDSAGTAAYFAFMDVLFHQQKEWATAPDPLAAVGQLAAFAGLKPEAFQACLKNEAVANKVLGRRLTAEKAFNIQSTPSFVIGGQVLSGNQPIENFAAAIEAAGK